MDSNENVLNILSNIHKTILKSGEQSRKPSEGSVCSISSSILFCNNMEISEYLEFSSATITIGFADELIDKVVDYCVRTMILSEESVFHAKASEWDVKFKISLVNVFFKPYIFQMTDDEKLSIAKTYKEQGVELYKKGKIGNAFYKFVKALQFVFYLESIYKIQNENSKEVDDFLVHIYNNVASCQLFYNNNEYVVDICTRSLGVKPNVKAYYRRALSLISLYKFEEAESDLLELLKLESNNVVAIEKLKLVRQLAKANSAQYNDVVKKMFS